jgi:hypothetical protein
MRKWLVGSLAVALVLVGALQPLLVPRPCLVTKAACERIEKGMTRAEVEAALGGPPGDYSTRTCRDRTEEELWFSTSSGPFPWYGGTWETWTGDEVEVRVCFNGGVVSDTSFALQVPGDPGPVGLVRWRLGRLKARLLP